MKEIRKSVNTEQMRTALTITSGKSAMGDKAGPGLDRGWPVLDPLASSLRRWSDAAADIETQYR
jgi:hypothetical protein